MPRRRKTGFDLPKGVYPANNGGYQYILQNRYIGMVGRPGASLEDIQRGIDRLKGKASPYSLKALIDHYRKSPKYKKKSLDTIRCYGYSEKTIIKQRPQKFPKTKHKLRTA